MSKVDEIIKEFEQLGQWEERYRHLIQLGKALPELPEEAKTEANKVKGCQSQVWLVTELETRNGEPVIVYRGDSDAAIVKGIVALLLRVYSGLSPQEVLDLDTAFIDRIGLRQHLSMSRANGLNSMLKQINLYAFAYQQKIKLGLV